MSAGHPSGRSVLGGSGMMWRGSACVALLFLIALRAQAQQAPAPSPPVVPPTAAPAAGTPSAPPPAPAGAPAASTEAPEPEPDEAALAAFQRGEQLYAQREYAAALVEFERAYELLPQHSTLYNIGITNIRLERWASAHRALAQYVELGGEQVSAARVQEVSNYLDILRQRTATLSLLLNVPDAEIHIDGERVAPTEISGLVVEPGEHVVVVTKPGFRPAQDVFHATHGDSVRVVLQLTRVGTLGPAAPIAPGALTVASAAPPAAAEPESSSLWLPWTLTGVLAAGWISTAALAIQARHDRDEIEQPGTPEHRIDAARRLHISLAVASDVLLAATLVSGGVSAYLTWWPSPSPSAGAGLGPGPVGGVGVGFSGQF